MLKPPDRGMFFFGFLFFDLLPSFTVLYVTNFIKMRHIVINYVRWQLEGLYANVHVTNIFVFTLTEPKNRSYLKNRKSMCFERSFRLSIF